MESRHNDPLLESHIITTRCRVKDYIEVTWDLDDLFGVSFEKNCSLYLHTLMYFHGTWMQRSLGKVFTCDLTICGVKGHSKGHLSF